MIRVAILAEQNFSLIDGSTVWLLNVCKLIALQHDMEPVLVLSHPLTNTYLADELPERVKVIEFEGLGQDSRFPRDRLYPPFLESTLAAAEGVAGRFDRVFVRGALFLETLLESPAWVDRVVAYTPETLPDVSKPEPNWLTLARAARTRLVVQSEVSKQAIEALSDYPAQVVHVVPPIVFAQAAQDKGEELPIRLCYSGKIDPDYGLDWLLKFCTTLPDHPELATTILGAKDTFRNRHKKFFEKFDVYREAVMLAQSSREQYHSSLSHAEAKREMGKAHFAFCLRHDRYSGVIEISTKIVEFCTLGVPPIVNDTALNRALFGDDYPYYVDTRIEDPVSRLHKIMRTKDSDTYVLAQERIAEIAKQFSASQLSERLGTAIRGSEGGDLDPEGKSRRILIATHDRKFLNQFLDQVQGDPKVEIIWQHWSSTAQFGVGEPEVPEGIDTVFCEWACENAVWHSYNKRPGTKLIVRLHRFEAFRAFPSRINWAAVDAIIVVSSYFREILINEHGCDPDRIHIIPQFIDWDQLQREKHSDARFTLGMVGINPFDHKRFDRAIDFLGKLRQRDDRFRLAVRSVMPWQIKWVWNADNDDKMRFEEVFRRIFNDPLLQGAVRFDPAGTDMEEWYRGVGTIVSSSDSEGCHTAVMEGLASGCDAVVYNWPGSRSLFGDHVVDNMANAVERIVAFANLQDQKACRDAFSQSMKGYDVKAFTKKFFRL